MVPPYDVSEQRQTLAITTYLRSEVQGRILQFLATYLETPHLVNQVNASAIRLKQLNWHDQESLRLHFFQQISLFKTLSAIQLGTVDGHYVGILRLENGIPTVEIKDATMGENKYAYALDTQGNLTGTCIGTAEAYNPQARPWYQKAQTEGKAAWSEVYQYSSNTSVQLGIMGVLPFYDAGNLVGVLGCDIALTHISQFLASLNVSAVGVSFIVDRHGHLIASSVHQRPFTIHGGTAYLMQARHCGNALIHTAVEQLEKTFSSFFSIQKHQQLEYENDGNVYLIDVCPVQDEYGLDWLVVTNLPVMELFPNQTIEEREGLLQAYTSLLQINHRLENQVQQKNLALREFQRDLQRSEERWQLALRGTNDGIWDWHIETNEVFFSDRWHQMLGYEMGELAQHFEEWKQRIHPEDLTATLQAIQTHLAGTTDYYVAEYRSRCKDDTYKWVLDRGRALWNEQGHPIRMVGSRTDITDRKRIEAHLTFQAQRDALTGLFNRAALFQHLEELLLQNQTFSVLFIDLDRFKVINDSLGHGVGDQLLIRVAKALETLMRSTDVVARLSGDEFVLIIQPIEEITVKSPVILRIQEILKQMSTQLGYATLVTASIGITSTLHSKGKPHNFLQDADIAMYSAKTQGGNQAVVFTPELRNQFFKHLQLEFELRQALLRQEFAVYYQPIMSLQTGAIAGFEALIRWHHPYRGLLPPSEFIPVAEDKGLIVPLGQWILEEACQQLLQWKQQYPDFLNDTFMNVNVSVKQFYQANFLETIDALISHKEILPEYLRLEITESCMMENTEVAQTTLSALNARHIHICIDDFGTGYSSLSHLHQFPVQSLKIDRTFINRIVGDDQGIAMVKAILALSQSLGISVTAEGIETQAQFRVLQGLGCQLGQGYLFAEPGDALTLSRWLDVEIRDRKRA